MSTLRSNKRRFVREESHFVERKKKNLERVKKEKVDKGCEMIYRHFYSMRFALRFFFRDIFIFKMNIILGI